MSRQRAAQGMLAALALTIVCAACGRQHERVPATTVAPAEPSAYQFLGDVIRSLEQAERGVRQGWTDDTQTDSVELMTANTNATIAIGVADGFLKAHASSQDTTRSKAATAIMDGFALLRRSLEIQLACYEHVDTATTVGDLAELSRMMSDGKVAYEQGSRMVLIATAGALDAALIPAPADTGHIALNMSDAERASLVAEIDTLFGKSVRETGDTSGPMAAARALRAALDQPWRVAQPAPRDR